MSSYSTDGFTLAAWGDPSGADPVIGFDPSQTRGAHGAPEAFIQWKGTDVCLDFYCTCGMQSHIDASFVYAIECPACGSIFDMPHTVQLQPRSTAELRRQQ